jgi:hypothetical protein
LYLPITIAPTTKALNVIPININKKLIPTELAYRPLLHNCTFLLVSSSFTHPFLSPLSSLPTVAVLLLEVPTPLLSDPLEEDEVEVGRREARRRCVPRELEGLLRASRASNRRMYRRRYSYRMEIKAMKVRER